MNFEHARHNMVEQQIRPWQVLDQKVLDLLMKIHREEFIPAGYRQLALADIQVPLPHGQVTMTPKVEARLLQSVDIQPNDKVLEIGTGCGYLTALLANAAREVVSVDIFPDFIEQAREQLINKHNINNVSLESGDAITGWEKSGPYDVIVVTGSVPVLDDHFQQQLTTDGRLFVIVGEPPVMEATLITRKGNNEWAMESLFETSLPPLIGAVAEKQFEI